MRQIIGDEIKDRARLVMNAAQMFFCHADKLTHDEAMGAMRMIETIIMADKQRVDRDRYLEEQKQYAKQAEIHSGLGTPILGNTTL